MHIALLEQIAPNSFTRTAFKKYIVRNDDRTAAVDFQERLRVLKKVQLLVLRRCQEILPYVFRVFLFQIASFVDDRNAAFLSKRRIGHHDAETLTGVTCKAVHTRLDWTWICIDSVQVQVHDAKACGVWDQFPALDE